MSSQPKTLLTPEEYLEIERKAEFRSEYFEGEMFPVHSADRPQSLRAGNNIEHHNLIVGNIFAALHRQFTDRPCNIYQNNVRLKVSEADADIYPDVIVVCGEEKFDESDSLLNPVLIVEVLSETTELYDRVEKFDHYRPIESFMEYLLVAQEPYRIERYVRQTAAQWLYSDAHEAEDVLTLETIDCRLALKDVYAKVK